MLIVVCAVVCLVLLVLGFVAPRRSRRAETDIDSQADRSERSAARAPGPLRKPLEKSAGSAQKAMDRSVDAGRSVREKLDP